MRSGWWCCRCFLAWGLWMNTKISIELAECKSQRHLEGRLLVGHLFRLFLKVQDASRTLRCWLGWRVLMTFKHTEHWRYVSSALQIRFEDLRCNATRYYSEACTAGWAALCFRLWCFRLGSLRRTTEWSVGMHRQRMDERALISSTFAAWCQGTELSGVEASLAQRDRVLVEASEVHRRMADEWRGFENQAHRSIEGYKNQYRTIQQRHSGILGNMAGLLASLQISLLEAFCLRAWRELFLHQRQTSSGQTSSGPGLTWAGVF